MTVETITPREFQRMIENGRPHTLIDVRTPAEFKRCHAASARLMPLDDLEPAAFAAQTRDSNDAIYVICQGGARAAKACERFRQAGISRVISINGGTNAWEQAGLPVERSVSKIISLERQVRIAAGALVFIGSLLAWMVHPAFLVIPAFIGAGLTFAGITDYCGMALMLGKMPWNR